MELFKVVTVEEAKKVIAENFSFIPGIEEIDISYGIGRIVSEAILSEVKVPGFIRSTVDGYAVKSKDTSGASEAIPAMLNYIGEVEMGKSPQIELSVGECVYVPTGGMLPCGADCVVMIEYTDKLDDNTILIYKPSPFGENLVNADEDIKTGEEVVAKGACLRPYELGVLSSIGKTKINVVKKLRVGIISTGDEVVSPETIPCEGQVRDINSTLLNSLVIEAGGEGIIYGVSEDTYESLFSMVEKASRECDMVLISGGSSVGKKDQTFKVMEALKASKILVHGLAIKPGKPTVIGKTENKIIFGLPGHPLACAVVFKAVVKYYMDKYTGVSSVEIPVPCTFTLNYHKAKGREEYLPVKLEILEDRVLAKPIFTQSGIISSFSRADGYIRIERNLEGIREGDMVFVYRF